MAEDTVKATHMSRRHFLKSSTLLAGSLTIAFHLPACSRRGTDPDGISWAANAFVRLTTDHRIVIAVNQAEMGQGVYTALPMLVAEELDVNWTQVSIEQAPMTAEYHHKLMGVRLTGGSTSVKAGWQQLRSAGATARQLLLQAAAQTLGVELSTLRTELSEVIHDASGRRLSYASLLETASALPTPEAVELKAPEDFRLIGTDIKRIEGPEKVNGEAQFSLDIQLPGMLNAVVARAPMYGGKVKHYRADKALKIPGVIKVKPISSGVAVIAKDFWTAKRARDQLQIEWEHGPMEGLSSTKLQQQYRELAEQPGLAVETIGDVDSEIAAASKTVDAIYECAYLAHAAMEPLNCTAKVSANGCELWVGTQSPSMDQLNVANTLGIKPEQVKVNATMMGGAFGRRVNHVSDFVVDSVEIAKDEVVPIKTIWTREEDIQGGYYRPLFTHKIVAGLDKEGMPTGFNMRIVGQSIADGMPIFGPVWTRAGYDSLSVSGAAHMPYSIAHRRIELHTPTVPMPVLWWRSVNEGQNVFARECFLDEVAFAGGKDPLALRQTLLADQARHLQVLNMAAEKAGWGQALEKGRAQGIAMQASFGSYVAQVAEVSVTANNDITIHRIICAVDCGIAVNPLNVRAQIEGAIIFGLSAALDGEITIEEGKVQQSNFHDYRVLRMNATPDIQVHIVNSAEAPGGIGEPGLPPIAPALANAIFAAVGKRVRKLPIRL